MRKNYFYYYFYVKFNLFKLSGYKILLWVINNLTPNEKNYILFIINN